MARHASTSRGPERKSALGSSGCAVLAIATMHGRCRSRSTLLPAPALPWNSNDPSSSTFTPSKSESDGATSVGVNPFLAAASLRSSRPAGVVEYASPWPYLAALSASVVVPVSASWCALVSSTMVASTLP
ncbi:Uncharacterised protein [Mycobacteroides abscessus subsp. abscessus]|nr:Uncharacterised protein [Mycobacteroides abscessus subsp. abscessus]